MFGLGKNKIKISVITWDASFREHFQTVDAFGRQDYPKGNYEFIWVDFYNNENPLLLEKISKYANARVLNLNHDKSELWHLGKCINAGISEAKGEILVIPDGDIVAPPNILKIIESEHERSHELVLYFRRWDESPDKHDNRKSANMDYLEKVCTMNYPTNYGGLITIRKKNLAKVNNYEESDVFSGPGANGLELYTRLRNKGFAIKWHATKIYHPYHRNTGTSGTNRNLLEKLAAQYKWINPYAGIEQSWIIKSAEMDLSYYAGSEKINDYLSKMPLSKEEFK